MIFDIHIQVRNKFREKKQQQKFLAFLLDEQNNFQSRRSNPIRSEEINNKDEHHLQVPRLKQLPIDGMSFFFFS